jgi:aminobenzoyl-glutamate utilization protein B
MFQLKFYLYTLCLFIPVLVSSGAGAQNAKSNVSNFIDDQAAKYGEIAQEIWDLAEVGYLENRSAALLSQTLAAAGFEVRMGVAGIPTAFVATWSANPGPIIGIMAEYDALPGISQDRNPLRLAIDHKAAGHACGHHLFGTGSVAAAIATKQWLQASGQPGEIRLYGTPAEEGGAGKVYMVRDGLFDDVDVMLHWHPASVNSASARSSLATSRPNSDFLVYLLMPHQRQTVGAQLWMVWKL